MRRAFFARSARKWVGAFALTALLAACGGGDPAAGFVDRAAGTAAAMPPDGDARRTALAAASTSNQVPTSTAFFEWAQRKWPDLIPAAGAVEIEREAAGQVFVIRVYSTGLMVGIGRSTGSVLVLVPGRADLLTLGVLGDFAAAIFADTPSVATRPSGRPTIALGGGHAVAVRASGSMLAWGQNSAGQLGSGPPLAGSPAREVATTGAVAAVAGGSESLVLRGDGVVQGWGRKFSGTTIIGGDASATGTNVTSPGPSAYPAGITHIAAVGPSHGLALRNDGTVWFTPTLGPVLTGPNVNQPSGQVPGLTDVVALGNSAAGVSAAHAIRRDGSVWRIAFAGGLSQVATATPVAGLANIVAVSCGGASGCLALSRDGAVFLVVGSTAPQRVAGLPAVVTVGMSTGSWHAVDADGRLWSWGDAGVSGIAGLGPGLIAEPRLVPGLAGVTEIAGGNSTVLVRLADGSVWGFGSNFFGELGQPAGVAAQAPVRVPGVNLN
jgi:hypothetical protein